MARIDIPRLDLQVKGIDAAVVRAALDRLPADLAAALRATQPAPDGETIHVSAGTDPAALASVLARRIASVVRQRTEARDAVPPYAGGGR